MDDGSELAGRLTDAGLDDELVRLGVRDEDRGVVGGWARQVADRPDDLRRLAELVRRLEDLPEHPELRGKVFEGSDEHHELGRGVLPLLAFVLTAPALRRHWQRRGAEPEVVAATLSDLGQQVWKDRQVNGSTGLHNQDWLALSWAGVLVKLGRLQFELSRSDVGILPERVNVLNLHIDETGPLRPEMVDDSLRRATTWFEDHFPEIGPIDWFCCHSWLLDPALAWRMPESNTAAFARRFTVWKSYVSDRDGLYFGFGIEPGPDEDITARLDELPTDTPLQRALVAHWRDEEHVRVCSGRFPVISSVVEA